MIISHQHQLLLSVRIVEVILMLLYKIFVTCHQQCNTILLVFLFQDFEIELEGAQTLRILVYKIGAETDALIGKCALEVGKTHAIIHTHPQKPLRKIKVVICNHQVYGPFYL